MTVIPVNCALPKVSVIDLSPAAQSATISNVAIAIATAPPVSNLSDAQQAQLCQQCGACCAFYRVSFYAGELDEVYYQPTPQRPAVAQQLNPTMACMVGTNQAKPRCIALQGTVGESVGCTLYSVRPSVCRQVSIGDAQCLKARRGCQLPDIASAVQALAKVNP